MRTQQARRAVARRRRRLVAAVSAAAGSAARVLPGLAGAAAVSYGLALVYLPLGIVAGGVFLLAVDRRI